MSLLDRHALLSAEKQFHLHDVIGDASWWVDLDAGRIVFGGELEMAAGLLGTQAAGRFLWGYANPGNFPDEIVAAGRELPEALAREGIDRVALIASGELGLDATYTGALDEDVHVLLALAHPALRLPEPDPLRLVSVITAVLESGLVRDWPYALRAYAEQRGVARDGLTVGGVTITLDELGRIKDITA
jgi:hypothetical protein